MCHYAEDEGNETGTRRHDRDDLIGRQRSPPPIRGSRLPGCPWWSRLEGMGPSGSPSPHPQPKGAPSEHHTESGPSSTTLSPHSSHTRMPPLEGAFTGQPLPIAATIAKLERPRGRHDVTASLKPAYPVAWSRAYTPPRPSPTSSDLDLHVSSKFSLSRTSRIPLPRPEVASLCQHTESAYLWAKASLDLDSESKHRSVT
jgi:hypothetical protein